MSDIWEERGPLTAKTSASAYAYVLVRRVRVHVWVGVSGVF